MLHKLAVILLGLVTFIQSAQAQDNNEFYKMQMVTDCENATSLRNYLEFEYGEIPFTSGPGVFRRFDGEFSQGLFRTYVNPETFSFTITVEFLDDNLACIIVMGDNFAPVIRDGVPL